MVDTAGRGDSLHPPSTMLAFYRALLNCVDAAFDSELRDHRDLPILLHHSPFHHLVISVILLQLFVSYVTGEDRQVH